MKYLVFCPCGHSLEVHTADGCLGDARNPCPCQADQIGALNLAIEVARDEAVAAWRRPEEQEASLA